MFGLALGLALLLALGIIGIGAWYLATPLTAMRGFGLPLPDDGGNIASWLRLKGVRDVASGVTVLALMISSGPRAAAIVLLARNDDSGRRHAGHHRRERLGQNCIRRAWADGCADDPDRDFAHRRSALRC